MPLYHLYGLAVESDFDCPELTEITPDQAKAHGYETVLIKRADAPLTLPEGQQVTGWMRVTWDACLYLIHDTARMLVERPDRITVEMLPGAAESDMRAYLFGTGVGTLMHMRGLIPLHISAVQTPDGVVAFTGPSGAGKSTKVAELHFKHGWPIICDDVAVLHPGDKQPLLHAGMNRIKLWKDAVERFGIAHSRLTRDILREDKFHLHAPEMFVADPLPLSKLVYIHKNGALSGTEEHNEQPRGADLFTVLSKAVYRPELCVLFGRRTEVMRTLLLTASKM